MVNKDKLSFWVSLFDVFTKDWCPDLKYTLKYTLYQYYSLMEWNKPFMVIDRKISQLCIEAVFLIVHHWTIKKPVVHA